VLALVALYIQRLKFGCLLALNDVISDAVEKLAFAVLQKLQNKFRLGHCPGWYLNSGYAGCNGLDRI
jgi:hypothetical protein